MADNARWFVVHTYSGYENKVASNIETVVENRKMQDQIFEVRIPTEIVTEIKDDSKKEVERKLFPGYVMVKVACSYRKRSEFEDEELTMTDEAWYVIRNTRGVTGFVGSGNKPTPLSDTDFEKIFETHTATEIDIRPGDTVRILSGLFENFSGRVVSIDEQTQKISVMVPMLKRETAVDLGYDEVVREE